MEIANLSKRLQPKTADLRDFRGLDRDGEGGGAAGIHEMAANRSKRLGSPGKGFLASPGPARLACLGSQ